MIVIVSPKPAHPVCRPTHIPKRRGQMMSRSQLVQALMASHSTLATLTGSTLGSTRPMRLLELMATTLRPFCELGGTDCAFAMLTLVEQIL